jgi:hypothetical protein
VAPDFGAEDDNGDIWVDFVSPGYISDLDLRLSNADSNPVEEERRRHDRPRIFHIRNPGAVPLRRLPQVLAGLGHGRPGLRLVPVDEWLAGLTGMNVMVMREYLEVGHRMFSMDDGRTREVLSRKGVGAGDDEL